MSAQSVAGVASAHRHWTRVQWRNAPSAKRWTISAMAVRVTPAHDWRQRRLAPAVWLLCERDVGATPRTKYYFIHLPATTSLRRLVRFAHQRWAIEQQYQELKTELGLDHFGGRTLPGWVHRVVKRRRDYGEVAPRKQTRWRTPVLAGREEELRRLVEARPDQALVELRAALRTSAALSTIWLMLSRLDLTV